MSKLKSLLLIVGTVCLHFSPLVLAAEESQESVANIVKDYQDFTVLGMACDNCARSATQLLSEVPGVSEASVTFEQKLARVRTNAQVTRDQLRDALSTYGFEAEFPGEKLPKLEPLPKEILARLDVKTISHGKTIRTKRHLAPRKITIFDYYADWCGPCHLLTPKLERLVLRYENVALRKVDIVDWKSEATRQATRDHKLPGVPFTVIYNEKGKLLGKVQGNSIEQIATIIRPHARLRERENQQKLSSLPTSNRTK